MKVHNDLEKLLEHFQIYLIQNQVMGSNAYGNAVRFLRSNSLALGKPEPLAKNKQWVQVCKHEWEEVDKSLSLKCKNCGIYDHP